MLANAIVDGHAQGLAEVMPLNVVGVCECLT